MAPGPIAQLAGAAWLVLAGGRSLAAQASGTIYATAQVVASPALERAVSAGLRMAAARPPATPRTRRRDLAGTTVLVDTPLDTTAARARPGITIIHW
jgi:hypothetical protein